VTRTFPLDRAGEALRTVEEGHARGKVVIEVAPAGNAR
jgi:NADPH:quinone reductase-like Zn-dependent oxidoreductase